MTEAPRGFPDPWSEGLFVKDKGSPWNWPLRIVDVKQDCILRKFQILVTLSRPGRCRGCDSSHVSHLWAGAEQGRLWEMTANCCQLKHMMGPCMAELPVIVSLLEQINRSRGPSCENTFFSISFSEWPQKQFVFTQQGQQCAIAICFRGHKSRPWSIT